VASQKCDQCGATVAADEQFCPSCGSFIDPLSPHRGHSSGEVVSISSDGPGVTYQSQPEPPQNGYEEFSLGEAPPTEPTEAPISVGGHQVNCPSCGAANPESNRHCQECGARISQGSLPTAPRPAVQATAGVRAALAISALLFVVIIIALIFNVFNGDGSTSDTTVAVVSTTSPTIPEPAVIDVLDVQCSQDGLGSLTCDNLISDSGEFQVNWEEIQAAEESLTIKLVFRQPMTVTRIDWSGIESPVRFKQNYRARGLTMDADGSLAQVLIEIADTPGLQTVDFVALSTNSVEITVESAYQAEVSEGNVFRELAIDKITVWGYPSNPSSDG
jgi:hypothetical protein